MVTSMAKGWSSAPLDSVPGRAADARDTGGPGEGQERQVRVLCRSPNTQAGEEVAVCPQQSWL